MAAPNELMGPIERALARATNNRTPNTAAPDPTPPESSPPPDAPSTSGDTSANRPTQSHVVTTIYFRRKVVKWMLLNMETYGEKGIVSRTMAHFGAQIIGDYHARFVKVKRWWTQRHSLIGLGSDRNRPGNITSTAAHGVRRVLFKALKGRGRKTSEWVVDLHAELLAEFERVKAMGVKLFPALIRTIAQSLIIRADETKSFNKEVMIKNVRIVDKVTYRWVQVFMQKHNIVIRAQTGKLSVSPEKQAQIEKAIAAHLGTMKWAFETGALKEDLVSNADETHFVFNMDNGRSIGFRGDSAVKYADVVAGEEGITMMVHIRGGRDARIECPFLIFQNSNRSYPIRNVPDTVPGVCYRSQPKGWMDSDIFAQWLGEPRAISKDPYGRKRVLFVDNCSGHNSNPRTEGMLLKINHEMRKLPPNATELVQPADSFVISKIKDAWRRRWDHYKAELITRGEWMNGEDGKSGRLKNPGKAFFLRLAADAVREVNNQRDKNGVPYARKAMIMTGISLNLNGRWEERQLTQELQEIIAKYRGDFEAASNPPPQDPAPHDENYI